MTLKTTTQMVTRISDDETGESITLEQDRHDLGSEQFYWLEFEDPSGCSTGMRILLSMAQIKALIPVFQNL